MSPATLVRNVECPPSVTLEETGNVKAPESEQGLEQAVCPICAKTVNDATELEEGDEAVFCDGECQCWLHWCCACLPKPEFDKLNEEDPFYCLRCSTLVQMKAIRELRYAVAILSTQVQDLQGVINAAGNKKEDVSLPNSSNDSDSATTEGWATVAGSHQRRQQDSGGGESQPSSGCSRRLDNKNNKNNANPAGRYPHGGRTGKGRGKASEREREEVKIGKLIVIVLCNPVMPVNKVMRYQHLATSRTINRLLKHLCLSLVKGESGEPSKPAAHKQWNVPYTNFNAQH